MSATHSRTDNVKSKSCNLAVICLNGERTLYYGWTFVAAVSYDAFERACNFTHLLVLDLGDPGTPFLPEQKRLRQYTIPNKRLEFI